MRPFSTGPARLVRAQVRGDPSRSVTILAAVAVATAAFTVLTGAADTSKVVADHEVTSTGPSAYDILVRPHGSETAVERASAQVRPGFLDGVFGGISLAQYHQLAKLPGVAVAAPVAMVGYTLQTIFLSVHLAPVVGTGRRQLFSVAVSTATDRGLSHIPSPPSYVYVTRRPLELPPRSGTLAQLDQPIREVEPGGRKVPICSGSGGRYPNPYLAEAREFDECVSLASRHPDLTVPLKITVPLLIEAVDPVAEAKLDGLNRSIIRGRYLRSIDGPSLGKGVDRGSPVFPVIVSSRNYLDDTFNVAVRRLSSSAADGVLTHELAATDSASRGGGPVVERRQVGMNVAYQQLVRQLQGLINRRVFSPVDGLWRVTPVRYRESPSSQVLDPVATSNSNRIWSSHFQSDGYVGTPPDNRDSAYRTVHEHIASNDTSDSLPAPVAVGVFDPAKIEPFNPLTHVPLGGYEPSQARPADARSRELLHGRDLLPNSNLAGYLAQPPQLVTTLSSLSALESSQAFAGNLNATRPISAIRIRVAGVSGLGPLSRARVNLVAQDIIERTGLQVDITSGSSPSTRVTDLPAGRFGRPALAIQEGWIAKGVALQILRAVDRKSLLLFILVLVVCGLFVLNAATAAVRARRQQLGVLACTGWSGRQLFTAAISEQAGLGLVAGVIGVLAAVPIAHGAGLHVTWVRAGVAVPAAVALAVLAALVPAWSASRAHPLDALRPPAGHFSSRRAVRSRTGLAVRNLVRARGRSLIAIAGLAVGICSTVLLLAITTSFNGQLAGDLLGEAVTVRVRGVDYAAIAVMLAIGVLGITDVLYLNIRERANELATLTATGWSRSDVARLITLEGSGLGLIGSLLGAVVGVLAMNAFTNEPVRTALVLSAVTVAAGTLLGALAAVLAVQSLPRRLSRALAEE
jgi:putative ABC transport system permease protein